MRMAKQLALLTTILLTRAITAQAPTEWRDDLVDHLAGSWNLTGKIVGRDAHHDVRADWVLDHQFLRIQEKTAASAPAGERPYDAIWFLGYDPIKSRYILHLMDTFGGRYSETLGYGTRDGNEIHFVFEYPDGLFRNTYRWNADQGTWQWVMDQQDEKKAWTPFADLKLTKAQKPPEH
jgi:hypothetical protein